MSFVSGPIAFTGTQFTELSATIAAFSKQSGSTTDAIFGEGGTYLISNSGSTSSIYRHSGTPASADYSVFADIAKLSGTGNVVQMGVCGRMAAAADTFYLAIYTHDTTNVRLFKRVAGTQTQIGSSYSYTLTSTPVTLELRMAGSAISVHLDGGAAVISATDGDITDAGKAGVYVFDMRQAGVADSGSLDNFDAIDAGGGSFSVPPPFPRFNYALLNH